VKFRLCYSDRAGAETQAKEKAMAEAPKQQVQIKADEKELLGQFSKPCRGASQRRGIHDEFYLHVPDGAAGQTPWRV